MKPDSTPHKPHSEAILKFPLYARMTTILIGLFVLISMLSAAQDIILPLMYAVILAILLSPLVAYMERKGVNRALAIVSVIFVLFAAIAALVLMLAAQADLLRDAMPRLSQNFKALIQQLITGASAYLKIDELRIERWITDAGSEMSKNKNAAIGSTLTSIGGLLSTAFLTPVYIFMFLFYKSHLLAFIHKLFRNTVQVSDVLTNTKSIIQSYLLGLCIEIGILSVLNSAGLLILGIDYAVLLGILGAMLNIIPYLGGIIGVLIYMGIALVSKPPVYALYVMILYAIIQFLDNNYIVPKIVGSRVKLNAFFSLLTVILGAALWGIPGMFLSIPVTAIIKLILDHMETLKHWGTLLGDIETIPVADLTEANVSNISATE